MNTSSCATPLLVAPYDSPITHKNKMRVESAASMICRGLCVIAQKSLFPEPPASLLLLLPPSHTNLGILCYLVPEGYSFDHLQLLSSHRYPVLPPRLLVLHTLDIVNTGAGALHQRPPPYILHTLNIYRPSACGIEQVIDMAWPISSVLSARVPARPTMRCCRKKVAQSLDLLRSGCDSKRKNIYNHHKVLYS